MITRGELDQKIFEANRVKINNKKTHYEALFNGIYRELRNRVKHWFDFPTSLGNYISDEMLQIVSTICRQHPYDVLLSEKILDDGNYIGHDTLVNFIHGDINAVQIIKHQKIIAIYALNNYNFDIVLGKQTVSQDTYQTALNDAASVITSVVILSALYDILHELFERID